MNTYISKELEIAGENAEYNSYAKKILKDKRILATILKNTTEEFRNYPIDEIISSIEGEPEVSKKDVKPQAVPEAIKGSATEIESYMEGKLTFDIVFYVRTLSGDRNKIYVNVEAQKSFYPGYDLTTRAVFYAANMLSQQLDTEFCNSNYDDIKKVYSIWICFNTPIRNSEDKAVSSSIVKFSMQPEVVYGPKGNEVLEGRYDIISVVLIRLGKDSSESENELIGMLDTLFSPELDTKAKKKRLSDKYAIPMTNELERGLNSMCNLAEGLREQLQYEITEEVTAKVTAEVTEKVTAEITAEVTEKVTAEVTEKVTAEMNEKLKEKDAEIAKLKEMLAAKK